MPTWMRNVFNLDPILTLSTSPNMRLASQKVRNISKGLQHIKPLRYTKKSEIYTWLPWTTKQQCVSTLNVLEGNHKATPLQSAFPCWGQLNCNPSEKSHLQCHLHPSRPVLEKNTHKDIFLAWFSLSNLLVPMKSVTRTLLRLWVTRVCVKCGLEATKGLNWVNWP